MKQSLELFDDITVYEKNYIKNQILDASRYSCLGILVDGINNFQLFKKQIQQKTNLKTKVIEISNGLVFVLIYTKFDYFNDIIKPELILNHYKIYSILLKQSLTELIIQEFNDVNENLFYIYNESEIFDINETYIQNAKEVKHTSSSPMKILYGFNNFSDLIKTYTEMIKNVKKWPMSVIFPSNTNSNQINHHNKQYKMKTCNKKQKNSYPIFQPLNYLHYFSFIEKIPPKPARLLNANKIYSINKVNDVQISHIYDSAVRTFVGFDEKFKCFQVFDFFIKNKLDSLFDIKLFCQLTIPKQIKYDLYYLETLSSSYDDPLLSSIKFKESFIFKNDFQEESNILSFNNKNDFDEAKRLFYSSLQTNFLFQNMKTIKNDELEFLFPKSQLQKNLFYIMFHLKILNKNSLTKIKLPNFTLLFKGSIIINKGNICSLDNKSYILVGFLSIQKRNKAIDTLKKSMYLFKLKSYYPESNQNSPSGSSTTTQNPPSGSFKIKKNLSSRSSQRKENPPSESSTTKLNPPSESSTTKQNLSSGSSKIKQNPPSESSTMKQNLPPRSSKIKENLPSVSSTIKLNPPSGSSTIKQNPLSESSATKQNPLSESSKIKLNPPSGSSKRKRKRNNKRFHWVYSNLNDNSIKIIDHTKKNDMAAISIQHNNTNQKDFINNNTIDFIGNNSRNAVDCTIINQNDHSNIINQNDHSNIIDQNYNGNITIQNDNSNITNQNDNSNITNQNDNSNITNQNDNSNIIDQNDNSNIINQNDINSNNINSNDKQKVIFSNNDIKANAKKVNKKEFKLNLNNNDNNINNEKLTNQNINNKYIVELNDYKLIKSNRLGSGSYGSIYLVENIQTHKQYAVKIKSKRNDNCDDFIQEIKFYTTFKNPTILSLHGYSMHDFNNDPKPTLILEYMQNGSVEQLLKKPNKLNETNKYIILIGIIYSMIFLHTKGVVHRDLKPANILLDENNYPHICDFGSSIMYNDVEQLVKRREKNIGSPIYMAPEIFLDKDPYSSRVDVYSFGMIAYELLTEKSPFYERKYRSSKKLIHDVINGVRPDLSIIPDDEVRAFFGRCWSGEPSERPTFQEIQETFESNKYMQIYHCNMNELYKFYIWYENNSGYLEIKKKERNNTCFIKTNENVVKNALKLYKEGNKKEAILIMKKNADKGSVEAMHYYAFFLLENENEIDSKRANIYLKKSANRGFVKSMILYGDNLLAGKGISVDFKEAARYYKKAADLGSDMGLFNYGVMLYKGRGVKLNKKEAANYFQLAADLGNVNGMFQYALMLHKGDGIQCDPKKAKKYYKNAIFSGDTGAHIGLGCMYNDGTLPKDFQKSKFYLKKACLLGSDEGMFNYGNLLCNIALATYMPDLEKEELFEEAVKWFKKSADLGNIESGTQFGIVYTRGHLHINDMNEVIYYLRKAAYNGSLEGMFEYGKILLKYSIQLFEIFLFDLIIDGYPYDMIEKLKHHIIISLIFDKYQVFNEKRNEQIYNNINVHDYDQIDDDFNENEEINDQKIYFEILIESKKHDLTYSEFTHVLLNVKNRLSNNFMFNNDKSSAPEEELTLSHIRQIANNLIGEIEKEKKEIPDLKGKIISEVKTNLYKSYEYDSSLFYLYISHFTISEQIRNEIEAAITSLQCFKYSEKNLCHQKDPNDIYDFYFFSPNVVNSIFHIKLSNVMKKHYIDTFIPSNNDTLPFKNCFYFDESLIPSEILEILLKYLETYEYIEDIKRNIFDGKQIVTYLIIKKGTHHIVNKSIEKLLIQKQILFESFKYPLQNDIIINEKMILQDKNDFYIILNEIESQKIKPINVERNKLFLYDVYDAKKLFQRFSFICFKNEIDKMIAVNHINSKIFDGIENVLQYDIELHYASIDEHFYSKNIRDQIPILFNNLKGVEDIQRNVVSIESPVERTYIGFDSYKHLKKCYFKFTYRLNVLLHCKDAKLFWRKKDLYYICFKRKYKFSDWFDKCVNSIVNLASDFQMNCTDLEYSSPDNFEQVYTVYIGFSSKIEIESALLILKKNPIPDQYEIRFSSYKEGESFINRAFISKEYYLYYGSL